MRVRSKLPVAQDPFRQFVLWFDAARRRAGMRMPEAVCLSTLGRDGFPEGRMLLLKGIDERGFVFYTNIQSAKGRELAARPRCALTFYWERLARQVRVVGKAERMGDADADAYFATRPRMSQLAAWASRQSAILPSRAVLERRLARLIRLYKGKKVPRPPHWNGFRVVPVRFEFWQGRPYRLHDRFVYTRRSGLWTIRRLYP